MASIKCHYRTTHPTTTTVYKEETRVSMKMDVVLPWEHTVCEECLRRNSHAIWLVKYGCFGGHSFRKKVRVVIDCEGVELVRVRAPPRTISTFRGQFEMCQQALRCKNGNKCAYAHSSIELDKWNAVKSILGGE